jgi:outer membrane lipoprotein-sorting protein
MATNFPANPIYGQTYSNGYKTWTYNGTFWQATFVSSSYTPTSYDLDDISNYTDGYINTFVASYNQNAVSLSTASNLQVTINGVDQRSFVYNSDTVWLSQVLFANKGFTVVPQNTAVGNTTIASGVIKFAEAPPADSDVYIKFIGGVSNITPKIYPFKPVDIVMGF